MDTEDKIELIRQVMGASHVYCTAVEDLLERTLAEATDEPLAMSQVKLLLLIARPGQHFKVSDVAEFMGVTNAAASRAIDRLVQRGFVDRRISSEDRRAVDLSLTREGHDLLERFSEVRDAELLRLMGEHPESRLRKVIELLDELSVILLDVEGGGEERCLRCGIHFRTGCVVRDVLGRACALSEELYGNGREEAAS